MNSTFQNAHIQVRLPGSGELCTFPVDSNTRFSDVFRALITKGCFTCPQGEHPVWVLLCGDQDLITWVSEENTFCDRFPFEEPPIACVPGWVTKEVHFTSYPDPLARAKAIYLYFEGSKSFMGHEGFLREYQRSPTQRVLVPVKSNLAAAGPALLFELSDHVEWLRQLDEDAESLLNGCDSLSEAPTKQQQVEEELPRLLEKGPVSNQEIIQHFKSKGIQDRTVNLVKGRLNIRSVRKGDKWYWQLNA